MTPSMTLVLFVLLGLLGYVLGILGFFRAGIALRETRRLNQLVSQHFARRIAQSSEEVASASEEAIETASSTDQSTLADIGVSVTSPAEPMPNTVEATEKREAPTFQSAESKGESALHHDFEAMLATRWGVWLGAVALFFAGVFLVRYAVDHAVLGPTGRCLASALLGVALLAAAEWLKRRERPEMSARWGADQAPSALAAGGVATLFGASYGAGPFYDLLSPLTAFVAMAASSFLGLLAALRYGPLTAAVGIIGAFATPALVTTQAPSLVGLFVYLVLATAGAQAVIGRTGWTWLGWAVAIADAAWILVASITPHDPQVWAAAVFVPVSATLGILLLPASAMDLKIGRWLAQGHFAIVAAAGLVLEALVAFAASRAAIFALTPLAAWCAMREPRLYTLPWLAAACGLVVFYFWNGFDTWDPFAAWHPWNAVPQTLEAQAELISALVFAFVYAALGFWGGKRANEPRWAALTAAVPVLTLGVCYWTIGQVEADARWGFAGLALAMLLTAATVALLERSSLTLAGVHAAGAVAALALAIAMTTHDQWLSTALAIVLPGLAWVTGKVDLPALRSVSFALGVLALVLLAGWLPYDYVTGSRTVADHPFITYAIPAAAFAVAAALFRRKQDDRLVALLETSAMATATVFVAVEIHLRLANGSLYGPIGFEQVVTQMLALTAQGFAYHLVAERTGRPSASKGRAIYAGVAAVLAVGLIFANPIITGIDVDAWALAGAYLIPAIIAALTTRLDFAREMRAPIAAYAMAAGLSWITVEIRLLFQPEAMSWLDSPPADVELWTLSGAWLAYGIFLLTLGVRLKNQPLRLAALAVIGAVCAKVFLIDMAELTGLWRVASFLGLGLALIGLGAVHRRLVPPPASVGRS